jgi:hypothetical protein
MRLVTILGMHRSGTSAFSGVARELGLGFGWLRKPGDLGEGGRTYRNAFNPKGNHENRELRWLHEEILERAGGSWHRPPQRVEISEGDRTRRDEVIGSFEDDPVAIKDPRLLLVLDLYRELDPLPIGVIRNPVSVAESLERRSREEQPRQKEGRQRGVPTASLSEWEALWRHYNYLLLAELERTAMPVVDFDRGDLASQARAALEFHGIEARGTSDFFDPDAATDPGAWRDRVSSPESLELWEALSSQAVAR